MKKNDDRFLKDSEVPEFSSTQSDRLGAPSKPSLCSKKQSRGKDGKDNVLSLHKVIDLQYKSKRCEGQALPYRESVCELCEKTVSLALDVPLSGMQAGTRCNAEMALARQIAMYLSHTTFSLLLTEVGLHFGRDRSTVAHACAVVEDRRDDLAFDVLICQLESLLFDARNAMGICFKEGGADRAPTSQRSVSGLAVYERKLLNGEA